jgi:fructose-1-phosphate kinase PfkB-like protein
MDACEAREHGGDSKRKHQVEGAIMQAKEWTRTDMTLRAPTASPTTFPISTGPITRSQAKKIRQEVHALLYEFQLNTY